MDPAAFCNNTAANPTREVCLRNAELDYMVVCYHQKLGQTKGLWRAENATNSALLAFILNLLMIITITRLLILVFRFFYLPRITAEILGGILLGPGFLGRTFLSGIYIPFRHTMTLETIGNLSLLYYMFLVGLEVDIEPVLRARKKTLSIAIAGFILPFPIGYALHYLFKSKRIKVNLTETGNSSKLNGKGKKIKQVASKILSSPSSSVKVKKKKKKNSKKAKCFACENVGHFKKDYKANLAKKGEGRVQGNEESA